MPRKPNPELADDENPELTEADFARMRPAAEVLREQFAGGAEHLLKPKRTRSAEAARMLVTRRRKPSRAKRRSKSRTARA
jgi:uncharacterized protein (DUF4415 family)